MVCPWLQPFEAFRQHRRTGLTRSAVTDTGQEF
jgi:hypothetical protein